jgi:ribA/ribD-fused uncharacterized protein
VTRGNDSGSEAYRLRDLASRAIAQLGEALAEGYEFDPHEALKKYRVLCTELSALSDPIYFYEREFYVLSNFSSFALSYDQRLFMTAEHLYHWWKFKDKDPMKQRAIQLAMSAHDAFKLAERWKEYRREDWDEIKCQVMSLILHLKAEQHEYVRRKLLETGDRELIEDSWRDDFWGWGPNRDGKNMLGKLWMEVRQEIRDGTK